MGCRLAKDRRHLVRVPLAPDLRNERLAPAQGKSACSGVLIMADISSANGASGAASWQTGRIERLFARLDQNGDGRISPDEFNAIGQKLPGGQEGPAAQKLPDLFKSADTDGDGFMSKGELSGNALSSLVS